jgi:hypothetical protein
VLAGGAVQAVEPANYRVGPVYLTPTLESRVGYVDNLFRSAEDEKDTGISVVKPRVQAWLERGPNTYSFTYEMADNRYFDSGDDDFTDNTYNLDIHQEFAARHVANLFAEYYDGHEERGTGLTEGIPELFDEPVKLQRTIYGGNYTYGARQARGRIRLAARGVEHQYRNFDRYTQFHSRDSYDYGATFMWKIAARTDVLAEVRYNDTEYDRSNPAQFGGSFDSEEYNYFVGLAWDATAKTSGSVRIGAFDREYDSSLRGDDDGFSWEVDLNYKPRSYSRFNLESRRYTQETNGLGDAVDTNVTSLSWDHDWSSRTSSRLKVGGGQEDYTSSRREDDIYDLEASFYYALRRWVDFGMGVRYEERDSDISLYDYDRNEIFLEARLSL